MIVIFGGTGTLGNALARQFEKSKDEVCIISRCELKQKQMQKLFPGFKYIVGDVRDHHWKTMVKPKIVYNLAAMKHVDTAEYNVEFCYDVNTNGTINTCNWAIENGAKYIFSSTDKAVLPINAYGASKMMAEKYVLSKGGSVMRWGNVLGSRGSVLHSFKETLEKENAVYITDTDMTRFWIHIDDAAKFMIKRSLIKGIHIPEMGAAKVVEVAGAMAAYMGVGVFDLVETGIRPGEKIHEVLESNHDYCYRSDDPAIQIPMDVLVGMIERVFNG